nr:LLM class flavin-dependent oxidoreductase [Pseudonocardiales bacterium]
GLAAARAAAAVAGRPADAVTAAVFVTILVADSVEAGVRGLDAFGRATYGLPLDELTRIQALVAGPPSHVAAGLSAYVAAGARHLVCRLAVPDLPAHAEQQERFAELTAELRAGIATASPQDRVPQPLPLSRTSGI